MLCYVVGGGHQQSCARLGINDFQTIKLNLRNFFFIFIHISLPFIIFGLLVVAPS